MYIWRFLATVTYKNGAVRSFGVVKQNDQFWNTGDSDQAVHGSLAPIRHHPLILKFLRRLGIRCDESAYDTGITSMSFNFSAHDGKSTICVTGAGSLTDEPAIQESNLTDLVTKLMQDQDFVFYFDVVPVPD